MINSLFEMIKSVFWWIASIVRDFIVGIMSTLFDPVIDALPDGFADTLGEFANFAAYANQWVPLDLGLILFVAYWTFVMVWAGIRMVISAIPGVW